MTQEELQEWVTLKLREILDPVVIKAGYRPEDYEIVWQPLESNMNESQIDLEELKKVLMGRDPREDKWVRSSASTVIEDERKAANP